MLFSVYIYLGSWHCELRVVFNYHTFFHAILQLGVRKVKYGKVKATLLQGAGLYIAKIQRPVFDKDAEIKKSNKPNYYYILEQLHNNQIRK